MAAVLRQTSEKPRRNGSKRKRSVNDERGKDSSTAKKTATEPAKRRHETDGDVDESIKHMDPGLLADHISKKIKRSFRDLSAVELGDKYLSQRIFSDTTNFDAPRSLQNLPLFLEHISDSKEDLSISGGDPGSPHTIVVAASGLRAADVTRSLRIYQSPDSAVAKLFAKHIKLPEAVDYVKRTKIGIGIGTPQRLLDLLEKDVLRTKKLKRIVIDGSHLDQKKRSVFDMKELLDPLTELLSTPPIKERLDAEGRRCSVYVF
ncbi:hypothetical protein GJ744_001918 [Endocarpon pusillum]|uniref:Protein cms1 n=1 Tax=Endocarpon pusillum TaxID=364733 RepID=A0A8H7E8H5_9EURO|nr:hypothetical protein GJ744_001918 [Endocarpon pusillum]